MSDTKGQGVAAVGFLVMAFTNATAGDDALKTMKDAKKQEKFYFENAAVIRKEADGKVHFEETGDMRMGKGAGIGALVGGVLGVLGGPAGIAAGAAAGAAIGAAATHGDAGYRDQSLKTVGDALLPGTSAVVAITSNAFLRAVQEQVSAEDTQSFVNNLAAEISSKLKDGKSVALGVLLTQDGLAAKEVAVDENSAEVVGLVITDEAVIAGAATVTKDQVSYEVAAATDDAAMLEAGVVTKEGAVIVDDIATDEGEVAVATVLLPDQEEEAPAEGEESAAAGDNEEKPAA